MDAIDDNNIALCNTRTPQAGSAKRPRPGQRNS